MGGLEPPASASQTRRAGHLRYTPADKSIIRSMHKRQDLAGPAKSRLTWHILQVILLLSLALTACQPNPDLANEPVSATPTHFTEASTPTETVPATAVTAQLATPSPTPDCLTSGGEVRRASFFSELLDRDFHFNIYLPPCYSSNPSIVYPVMYLLHGLSYTNEQWLRLGLVSQMDELVASGEIPPFIIVLPLESTFIPPQISRFDDALVNDLVPWIDAHYHTLPDKQFRGIAGLSRGAAWSVRIGFENIDLFNSVGAHSLPLFEADGANVNAWLTQIPAEDLPVFFIDIGRNDQEVRVAQDFANKLDENNIPHEWYLFTGGHTEEYWASHLAQYLRWYARDWSAINDINEVKLKQTLPPCPQH